jgi:hypothetical protein
MWVRISSIEGFGGTAVRHPVRQAVEDAEKTLPNGSPINDPEQSTSESAKPLPEDIEFEEFDP